MWFAEPEHFLADRLAALVTDVTGGEPHVVLAPEPVWLDETERAQAEQVLDQERARYGGPADQEEPDLHAIATLLSTPPEAGYGWVSHTGDRRPMGVLAARCPWFGLIAAREDDDVWIRTFWREDPSVLLTEVLSDWRKPREQPISVLRSELLATNDLVVPSAEVRRAQRVAALPQYGVAEFYAEIRRNGTRRRSPHPVRVYDNVDGRWTMKITPLPSDERLELAPASAADVVRLLDQLRRDL
ncbi:ESX secretion-associated protein EspG [Saccharothrix sp. AJ9571]|nr:ESX secretion-associated protein EspG [Saccharothrix sp. AJ9571]